jgi:GNAT superfamily N-acetyltransferase
VTSRGDVHYVVTEYGIADLWGKNVRQRAMSLIEIAHPDYRSELLTAAKHRRYVFSDQVAPRASYPWTEEARARSSDGKEVLVRPVRLTDEETLRDLFYRLSDESTYRRFMFHKRCHPHAEMQSLVDVDYEGSMALVVCVVDGERSDIVAMARYDVDRATHLADIAFVVRDEWQKKGIGTLLLQRMIAIARARGIGGLTADVLASNTPMLALFRKCGLELDLRLEGETYHVVAPLSPREELVDERDGHAAFADGGCDPLDRARADVPAGEDAR